MLDLIIKERCPNAKQTHSRDGFVLNPMIAAGDPVQIKVSLESETTISEDSQLPQGWQLCNMTAETKLEEGENFLTLNTPTAYPSGPHQLNVVFANGQTIAAEINVVEQVGQH